MSVEFQVAVDRTDPRTLAAWWADVLGYTVEALPDDSWCAIVDGNRPRVLFHAVPEPGLLRAGRHRS